MKKQPQIHQWRKRTCLYQTFKLMWLSLRFIQSLLVLHKGLWTCVHPGTKKNMFVFLLCISLEWQCQHVSTVCLSQSGHFKCVYPQNITLLFVLPPSADCGRFYWNTVPHGTSNPAFTSLAFTAVMKCPLMDPKLLHRRFWFFVLFCLPWPTILVFHEGFQDINS